MITGALEVLWEAFEESCPIMGDRGELAVHNPPGPDDVPAKVLANALVPKANTHDGEFTLEGFQNIEAGTGLVGITGTGGKEDPVRLECTDILDGNLVVSPDGLGNPHLAVVLDEVIGKGVEIVDDEHHRCVGIENLKKMQNQAKMAS